MSRNKQYASLQQQLDADIAWESFLSSHLETTPEIYDSGSFESILHEEVKRNMIRRAQMEELVRLSDQLFATSDADNDYEAGLFHHISVRVNLLLDRLEE